MGKSILITGGTRSGKSRIAEAMTKREGEAAIYIATAEPLNSEMADRIARHQVRRGPEWRTVNAPLTLHAALSATDGQGPRLVDCLTIWLSNLMHADHDWQSESERLAKTLAVQTSPVILVTNEVGAGIVPENTLARAFRDAAGELNQTVAEAVDEVYLAVSGYPLKVKPNAGI